MTQKSSQRDFALTRRQILRLMGLGSLCYGVSHPLDMLGRSLVDGLISDAQAQAGFPAKRFVSILFPGAIPNWIHGFITPNNESIIPNASMKNALAADSYNPANPANTAWRSVLLNPGNGRTIYGSPLWNAQLPTTNGATVFARQLLRNLVSIRGVNCLADIGHVLGPARILYPLGATASLTGLVADANDDRPLAAIGCKGSLNYADEQYGGYKSLKGITPSLINSSTNALSTALSPFIITDGASQALATKLGSTAVHNAMNSAMTELGGYAKSQMPGADILYKNRDNAEKLFSAAFGDLAQIYAARRTAYEGIINACRQMHIPYILPATGTAPFNVNGSFSNEIAWQFAVAEYLLTTPFEGKLGLSSSISLSAPSSASFAGLSTNNDEHSESDRQRSVICHSFMLFSLLACLHEFIRVLKAANIFHETVISIASEYGRNPRQEASPSEWGSDHDTKAGQITLISGAVPDSMGPLVLGHIYTDSTQAGFVDPYTGTWGVGAPTPTAMGTIGITVNHAAATTAALLGVPSPVNAPSLLAVDSTGMVSSNLCSPPQNV